MAKTSHNTDFLLDNCSFFRVTSADKRWEFAYDNYHTSIDYYSLDRRFRTTLPSGAAIEADTFLEALTVLYLFAFTAMDYHQIIEGVSVICRHDFNHTNPDIQAFLKKWNIGTDIRYALFDLEDNLLYKSPTDVLHMNFKWVGQKPSAPVTPPQPPTTRKDSPKIVAIMQEMADALASRDPERMRRADEALMNYLLGGLDDKTGRSLTRAIQQTPAAEGTKLWDQQKQDPKAYLIPDPADKGALEKAKAEMNSLIGLTNVKTKISELTDYLEIARERKRLLEKEQVEVNMPSLHAAYLGNPGTGKTTMARIIGRIYHAIGLLSSGHTVEVGRGDLVGEYIGHTAIKTREVIERAKGGVLFIDEAYSLTQSDSKRDFGHEAIAELVAAMENNREDLVVIFAGYTEEMIKMIESNPGLKSRVTDHFKFEDYNAEELYEIGVGMAKTLHYELPDTAAASLRKLCQEMDQSRDKHFGNAREMRTMLEKAQIKHGVRLKREGGELTRERLTTFAPEDFSWEQALRGKRKNPLGFAIQEALVVEPAEEDAIAREPVTAEHKEV